MVILHTEFVSIVTHVRQQGRGPVGGAGGEGVPHGGGAGLSAVAQRVLLHVHELVDEVDGAGDLPLAARLDSELMNW